MAGLWCVNIGYGRTELAEVAAEQMRQLSYFPHTAMNLPAAALAEKINGLMGGGYHTYFVNSGSETNEAGFKIARQYMKHEYPGQYRFKTVSRYYAYHGTARTAAQSRVGGLKRPCQLSHRPTTCRACRTTTGGLHRRSTSYHWIAVEKEPPRNVGLSLWFRWRAKDPIYQGLGYSK